MALLTCRFFSHVLDRDTALTALVPEATPRSEVGLVTLLHGGGDDHTAWTRRTSLERYAAATGLAIVMPSGDEGYWTDGVHGARWWTFLAEELPAVVAAVLAIAPPPSRTFAAGLSRGGYGALKLGLRHPERFAAIAALSPKVDVTNEDWSERWRRDVFGDADRARAAGDELFALASAADPAAVPPILLTCGIDDPLLDESRRFAALARSRGLLVEYAEVPGAHEWSVWDRDIQPALARFEALRVASLP